MKGDMTQGNIYDILITLAIPLILGNIFQQLYNIIDAIIVGRFIGKNALASIGAANPIMSLAIFFILGICMGISVIVSQFFGAGRYEDLKKEIATALIAGTIFTIAVSIICMLLSKWALIITNAPREILNDADIFLKIIFGGLIFSFLYNFYSAVLISMGDSKTPLIFLSFSCVLNVILCIVLVSVVKLGVAGAAIATVISPGVSFALCLIYVNIKFPLIRLKKDEFAVDKLFLKKTIQYSWVTAIQQTCLYIGILLLQGIVNSFGTNAIAAYNSAVRVDSFILAPGDSFSSSISSFSGQNKGGEKWERIIEGYKKGNIILTVYIVIMSIVVFLQAENIMNLFVSRLEEDIILIGSRYLKLMSFIYVLSGFCNIFQGLFRGVGKLRITFIATILQMTVRVGLSYILASSLGISGICYSIAVGWIFMIIYEGMACRKYFKEIKTSIKVNEYRYNNG